MFNRLFSDYCPEDVCGIVYQNADFAWGNGSDEPVCLVLAVKKKQTVAR